jgi:hypothetical protein
VYRYFKMSMLCGALVLPIAVRAQETRPEPRRYEDRAHHDSHEWNDKEAQAYRRYLQEHHKKDHDFAKASKREKQDYWNWRHNHPDEDRH